MVPKTRQPKIRGDRFKLSDTFKVTSVKQNAPKGDISG